ncbi:SNF7 family protein [Talaromyces stipitatus ATCC 10500]|uniref:Vacuolar-sorting protein SNF7 n=1 Tax=Talaromyces stipitatus (strain ATCC 10500 / CBS 375.48 / QM 6759 / NRRL 1006) TaxID=441959 RepID=B8LUN9_TALSN|nr:SNF7 family protein [Talaromyces stipitatus ATCC 10500]EED23896.1 SNF7 family protein [Talaromyces stipitatus ATCC 10500]
MWSWFGGQSAQKRRDAPKEAILKLREQLDMLQKREKHLENQIVEQEAIAKKNVTTNKNAAKAALRRKKMHEKNLEQTQNQVMQLEQQVYSIETANINQETLYAMDSAGNAMKRMHTGLTMEKVDSMMETLREQQALADDIAQVITTTPFGEQVDDDELESELADLEQETIDERMLKTGTVPVSDQLNRLPAAANGELKGKAKQTEEEDEEAELEKLRAEMAMG